MFQNIYTGSSLLLAACLFLASPSLGQSSDFPCGTELTAADGAQALVRQAAGDYQLPPGVHASSFLGGGTTPVIVLLTFHVVRESDGSGGLSQSRLDQALLDANNAFAPAGIEFCLGEPIQYIDDDSLYYDIDTIAEVNALRNMNPVPGTIDIYFTEILNYESGGLCGISAFTTSTNQSIAMRNSCTATSSNASTFPHELGHFFDLYHTHEPFFGEECPDGSNCDVAGDLVCDTPADPRLTFGTVSSNCQYTGSDLGPCSSLPYAPDVNNLMSYSRKECRTDFSPDQHARALATLLNLRPELVQPFCSGGVRDICSPAVPNSTGGPAVTSVSGSGSASDNDLTLQTGGLPMNVFGYYINGQAEGAPITPVGSQGLFCLGGSLGRYNATSEIAFSGVAGSVSLQLDLPSTPTSTNDVPILSGQTWYFQLWYRDVVSGVSTSNFSNALSVSFL